MKGELINTLKKPAPEILCFANYFSNLKLHFINN